MALWPQNGSLDRGMTELYRDDTKVARRPERIVFVSGGADIYYSDGKSERVAIGSQELEEATAFLFPPDDGA